MRKLVSRTVVLIAALVATGGHLTYRMVVRQSVATAGFEGKWIQATVGSSLIHQVRSVTGETSVPISAVAPGKCLFLVIASGSCGASKSEMTRWMMDLDAEGSRSVRPGWHLAWFIAGDSAEASTFVDPQFPIEAYVSRDWPTVVRDLRVLAYPAHVILDREGRVIGSDIGATLPSHESLREDCSVEREKKA